MGNMFTLLTCAFYALASAASFEPQVREVKWRIPKDGNISMSKMDENGEFKTYEEIPSLFVVNEQIQISPALAQQLGFSTTEAGIITATGNTADKATADNATTENPKTSTDSTKSKSDSTKSKSDKSTSSSNSNKKKNGTKSVISFGLVSSVILISCLI